MASGRRFELVRELGAGAFGTVYLAYLVSSSDFRKKVAIKLLNGQWDQSGDAGRRLRDEARLLGLLRHRAIVQVDDLVMLDGRWAVVMEHIGGADLERVLEALWKTGESFPPAAAMEVISSVASALDAAYNGTLEGGEPLRVIHRDIKPSNVRLTPDGDIKVLDFGIARADFSGREAKTEQVRYGSLGYMAPERVLGDEDGPSGDIYALGCVLVELLRGKAFGRSGLVPDQQEAQVAAVVAEIREKLGPVADPALKLLQDLLAYEPNARPTAGEVADRARKIGRALGSEDLREFARRFLPAVTLLLGDESKEASGHLTEAGFKDTTTQAVLVEGSPFAPTRTPSNPNRSDPTRSDPLAAETLPLPRRSRFPQLLGAAVLLLLLGGGAVWFLRRAPEPAPAPVVVVEMPTPSAPTTPALAPSAPTEPAVEAAPTPAVPSEPSPTPRGARTTRAPVATTTAPATTSPAPVETAPVTTPTASSGATVRAVKFAAADASRVTASCGGVQGTGTTSALLRDAPVGSCTVSAEIGGQTYRGSVIVDAPAGFTCSVVEGALACR